MIVTGETGSGKSTQVPQYILGYGPNRDFCNVFTNQNNHFWNHFQDEMTRKEQTGTIFVTQPRRIAAISIAERVASKRSHKEWTTGENGQKETVVRGWGNVGYGLVGYQVGLERMIHEDCRITYMTPAIVTNRMQSDRLLDGVKYLIIDEVHERDLDTEMLLLLASNLLKQNPVTGILSTLFYRVVRYLVYYSV